MQLSPSNIRITENTPQINDEIEDEVMQDAPASDAENGEQEEVDEEQANDEEDEAAAQDSEPPSKSPTPQPEPIIRKRRLGRPPKVKPPGWDTPDEVERDGSDIGTPIRRRGRGGFGRGGR